MFASLLCALLLLPLITTHADTLLQPGLQQRLVNSFSFEQDYLGNGRYNEMAVTSGMRNALRLQNCN